MAFGGSQAVNAGTIYCRIAVENRGALRDLASFNSAVRASADHTQRQFGMIRSGLQATSRAAAGLAVVAAVGVGGMLKLASSYEQTGKAMTTLLKSADAAKLKLAELRDFAMRTPFQFTQLTEITRLMLAYKFQAQDLIPVLTDVGDAVAGLGGEPERLQRVVVALGQIQAKGKLTGEEMRQLAENGISAWSYVATALGKSTAEVMKLSEKGLIPAKVAIDAIRTGMRADFGGMMAEQAKTTAGQFSNLKDQLEKVGTEMGTVLLPTANKWISTASHMAGVIDGLSDSHKALVANLVLGTGVTAVAVMGIAAFANALFTLRANIGGVILARQAHQAVLAQNIAAQSVEIAQQQALALAQMRAAQTALDDALTLEELFVATGQATAADIAFIDAEKAKAIQMARNAQLASEEAAALVAGANAQRVAFLGLTPVMWGLVAVVGAAAAAWYLYTQREHAAITQASLLAAHQANEVKRLEAVKSKRTAEAAELKNLARQYEELSTKSKRTDSEQVALAATKKRLAERMVTIRQELGLQAKAWDGNTKSVNALAQALQDMTQIERQYALEKAKSDWANALVEQRKAEKEARDARYGQGGMTRFAAKINRRIYGFMPTLKPADEEKAQAAEYASSMARSNTLRLQEQIKEIEHNLKNPQWVPTKPGGGGGGGGGTAPVPTVEKNKPVDPADIMRSEIAYVEKLLAHNKAVQDALVAQHRYTEAAKQQNEVLYAQNLLREKLGKAIKTFGADSPMGIESADKLAQLQQQIAEQEQQQVDAARELQRLQAERTRTLEDDYLLSQKITVEANRRATVTERALLIAKRDRGEATQADLHRLNVIRAMLDANPELMKTYAEASADSAAKLRAWQEQQLTDATANYAAGTTNEADALQAVEQIHQAMLIGKRDANEIREINTKVDESIKAIRDITKQAAEEQEKLRQALLKSRDALGAIAEEANRNRIAMADYRLTMGLTSKLEQLEEERAYLATLTAGTAEYRTELLRIRDLEQDIADDAEREAKAKQEAADAAARLRQEAKDLWQQAKDERLRGMRERGEWTAADDLRAAGKEILSLEGEASWLTLTGRGGSKRAAEIAVRLEQLRNEVQQSLATLAEPGRKAAEEAQQAREQSLRDFGKALWDFNRDRGAIKNYFRDALSLIAAKGMQSAWEQLTIGKDGKPSPLDAQLQQAQAKYSWAGKLGTLWDKNKTFRNQAVAGMAAYHSIAGDSTTNVSEGRTSGALSGAMAGFSVGGPIGAAVGALAGGIFGGSEARKRAEEEARRQRDAMLSELRKMNNALQPVADFFRQGIFNGLTQRQTFGGGGPSLADSIAMQTSRGAV